MAEDLLRDNPELRPFVLSDVLLTGTSIGCGSYGKVEEVQIPVGAAAKTVYDVFQDKTVVGGAVPKAVTEFVRECRLMSTLRHPYIVQFLGVCFFPGSRLPALVMERLLTSLHDLLEPETPSPPGAPRPLSFFKMDLKCSVLHNVASGLAFLHERSPPIIHRDLSARNILLNSGMVAKVADLGVARIAPRMRAAATMTKAPGTAVYMPPEATAASASNDEKSKYDASIDIFSLGVVAIFAIGEAFPCDLLAHNYTDEVSGLLVARTELQRRSKYMQNVTTNLHACGQRRGDHPLNELIQQCLQNVPAKRPGIREVLRLLEEARAGVRDKESEKNKHELVQALQIQPRNQNLKHVLQDVVTKNAALQSQVQKVTELQHQLQSSENKNQAITQQLMRKEAELTRIEETIKREQQKFQEMRKQGTELVQAKDRELAQAQQQLKQKETEKNKLVQAKDRELDKAQQQLRLKEEQLKSSEALVTDLRIQLAKFASYTCQVSGPGLQSATVNHPTHIVVELSDSSGRPSPFEQNVTAELEPVSKEAKPTRAASRRLWSKKPEKCVSVAVTSPSRYKVSYTSVSRGQHKLNIQVNGREINGSPFTVTVYPDPTQLGRSVRAVTGLVNPYGITFDSRGRIVVSECGGDRVSIFDISGQMIQTFGDKEIKSPAGIAIDDMDNIYVSSEHRLQKFTSSGELIKCVGKKGSKKGEFDDPRGVTLYGNQVHVCDRNNHRIQVFDLDLNFVRSIGTHGKGTGKFDAPFDVKFDNAGNMYVADYGNKKVQVMDKNCHFKCSFDQEGEGKLGRPLSLHIADKYVYVCDHSHHCIVVYETSGLFITSFGTCGHREGEFDGPYCIASCANGFIYVCDYFNDRVQVF